MMEIKWKLLFRFRVAVKEMKLSYILLLSCRVKWKGHMKWKLG